MSSTFDPESFFGPQGPLARSREGFELRTGQKKMAMAVARAWAEGRHLVVEAGTGTGKTLAYLVPALFATEPVILSTGTKALQDQILQRELPAAIHATGMPRDVVLLKGRENYLCRKRLEEFEAAPRLDLAAEIPLYRKIVAWARRTTTGDRAEVEGLPDASPLWSHLDGRAEFCTGGNCPHFGPCFVLQARRRASKAQAVIVNHFLLFADIALRAEGAGKILPDCPLLVLDEAHLAEEAAIQHFGARLSLRMAVELGRDAAEELKRAKTNPFPAQQVEKAARAFFKAIRPREGQGRVGFDAHAARETHSILIGTLEDRLDGLAELLRGPGERGDERALLVNRAQGFRGMLQDLLAGERTGEVATVETQGREGAVLGSWPIDVGPLLEERLAGFRSVIATSATLAVGRKLDRSAARLGIPAADKLIVPSPFDHANQAALYIPREFPEPGAEEFPDRSLREIEELLSISQGRGLVLFASHKALKRAAEHLRDAFPWPVLVQGDGPREQLVKTFREEIHSVLLGTASFRQGIDVPGQALSLVIVDKLPFAVPDDPLIQARAKLLREGGRDPFMEDQLPEAILALRQALGRLIRTRSDRGLLALLDVRVRLRRYGKMVLESLPPWPLLEDLSQARDWFHKIAPGDK